MTASRQKYIEEHAAEAMEQMRRYGIPASITLAQGIIESAEGKSMLSRTANNHFGVKGEFNGQFVRADDDKPNEKFKKYDNVGQSYEDHSKVLMADRYQKYTRNLSADDYKGWAAGIKAGGYATAKNYVSTIVGVIEGANLQKYDQMVIEQAKREGKKIGTTKRGESVQSKEKGVPFNWYNWKEYVNRHNPEDVISREDYKALDEKQQAEYKGVRTREVRALFNIDQTTLPFVDKERYEQEVKTHGTSEVREHSKSESDHLRISVNDFILKTRDNLVPIRLDGSGVAHYDAKKDTVYMPSEKDFESYKDFTNELMRQVVSATGNAQRLGRNGMNNRNTSPLGMGARSIPLAEKVQNLLIADFLNYLALRHHVFLSTMSALEKKKLKTEP